MSGQVRIFADDSIMRLNEPVTAGSKIMEGFKSPFDAAVVEKLYTKDLRIEKSLIADEFGIDDLFSENDTVLSAVSEAKADASVCVMCNDIFGKVKRQAAVNGLYYLQPTYGTVSRYGLIPTASSMDQIGIVCSDYGKGFDVLAKVAGNDSRDGVMWQEDSYRYKAYEGAVKVAVPDNVWDKNDTSVIEELTKSLTVNHMELSYYEVYHQLLYILSSAEICNNTNRYDGVKFGYRNQSSKNLRELYFKTRSEGFTLNTKLAVIMGANVLTQDNYVPYYEKAMKIRRLIKEALIFDSYDVIALPIRNSKSKYEQSALYALTALAGLPSLTVPYGNSGIQFVANVKREDILMRIADVLK